MQKTAVHQPGLPKNCFLNAFFSMLLVCGYQLLQPYLAESGMQISNNGLLYCMAALFASCGSFFFDKLNKMFLNKRTVLVCCILLISCCFFGLAKVSGVFLIFLFVCCYRLIWGVTSPLFSYMVNNSISGDECRDTIFSIISLLSNLFCSVFLFLLGLLDLSSYNNYFLLSIMAVLFLAVVLMGGRRNGKLL